MSVAALGRAVFRWWIIVACRDIRCANALSVKDARRIIAANSDTVRSLFTVFDATRALKPAPRFLRFDTV